MNAPDVDVLPQERQQRILEQLRRDGRVVAGELAVAFAVSEDSIRRDLREMAAQGLCRRVYGGALLPTPQYDALAQRIGAPQAGRTALAGRAAALVQPGQVVLLDAGSTNVEIARALRGKAVTVVTNAPAIAAVLGGEPATELVVIGGRIDPFSGGAIGAIALRQLDQLQVDVCIPGACAVDPDSGVWGIHAEDAAFKQAMIRISGTVIIVATAEKIGARASFHIAGINQVDHLVISDSVPAAMQERFALAALQLHPVAAGMS